MNRASAKQFKDFLRDYVKFNTLIDILDLFHAYVGYCIDPSSLLSPLSKCRRFNCRSKTLKTPHFDNGLYTIHLVRLVLCYAMLHRDWSRFVPDFFAEFLLET